MSEYTKLNVPKGIRYLSDWKDFDLSKFPKKCIINKQIPGCGFTEHCINCNLNIILDEPRRVLLKNKFDQHPDDVFLVVNEMDQDPGVDKDISTEKSLSSFHSARARFDREEEMEKQEYDFVKNGLSHSGEIYEKIKKDLIEYCDRRKREGKPYKILVTYDSFRIVREILIKDLGIFNSFYVVVDEFQSILHDSRFKSTTELQFMTNLGLSHSALFVSATPMMKEYIDMLEEFKDLPYFDLDWREEDPGRVTIPKLDVRVMRTVTEEACKVVNNFLDGKFEKVVVMRDGKPVEVVSDKIVLYVNSVNHITTIIKRCKVPSDRVNIICADTDENKKKIKKKLGKKYQIGHVPLRNEPEPDITICTRTSYLGADFYSTCARTFVFSDANIDSLAVDISEDLPQILGRQRLDENPWKNCATFYYKSTADWRKMTKDDFDMVLEEKMRTTNLLLSSFSRCDEGNEEEGGALAKVYKKMASSYNYRDDYVAVNRVINSTTGKSKLIPLVNRFVRVSEIRAFSIQQIDYKDRFTVFAKVSSASLPNSGSTDINQEVREFFEEYNKITNVRDRLRFICLTPPKKEVLNIFLNQLPESDKVKSSYLALGPERIRSLSFNSGSIKSELSKISFNKELLRDEVYSNFSEGDIISKEEIKSTLKDIYKKVGYNGSAKATDIFCYFETSECVIYKEVEGTSSKKKQVRCFKLLKKKM